MENPSSESLPIPSSAAETPPTVPSREPEPEKEVPEPAARDRRRALLLAGLYLLFFQITPRIPFDSYPIIALTALLSLPMILLFTVSVARAMRSGKSLAIGLVVSGLLILPSILIRILFSVNRQWAGWKSLSPLLNAYGIALYTVSGVDSLLLIWFAACIGVGISRLVREMKMLLPISVALALVDLYAVFGGGIVAQAQSGHAPVAASAMRALTAKLPTVMPKSGAAPLQLAIGFADFLFIALFFACFAKFRVPSRPTFLVMCGVLTAYMVVVAISGLALPALVPIAVVVIGMNLRRFQYERSELFALLYAALIVAAVAGGFWFVRHR